MKTLVNKFAELELTKNPNHINLFQKQFITLEQADLMRVALSNILYEKITYNGAVIPHYHDVCEIICLIKGNVKVYIDGVWKDYKEGDTLLVPAGVVHSVANINKQVPSEQISFFIPTIENYSNSDFGTTIVDNIDLKSIGIG